MKTSQKDLPEGSVVEGKVTVIVCYVEGRFVVQQEAHHIHVALVTCDLQARLPRALTVNLKITCRYCHHYC